MALITRGLKSNLLVSRGLGVQPSAVVVTPVVGGNFKKTRKVKIGKTKLVIKLVGKLKVYVSRKYKIRGFAKTKSNFNIKVKANVINKLVLNTFGTKTRTIKQQKLVVGSKKSKANLLINSNGNLAIASKLNLELSGAKKAKANNDYLILGSKYKNINSDINLFGSKQSKVIEKFTVRGLDNPFKINKKFTELQQVALMDVDL
jgi:hypothetical protein